MFLSFFSFFLLGFLNLLSFSPSYPWKKSKLTTKKSFSRFGLVSICRLERPVFFPVQNIRIFYTRLLASMVYTDRTNRYGTKLTSLHYRPKIISLYGSVTHWHCDRLPIGSCFNYLRQKMWSTLYIVGLVGRELKLEEMLWR